MEKHSDWLDRRGKGNWGQVFALESRMEEQLPNLSEMELEDSSKGPTTFDPWHFHGFLGPKRR